ncbi:MULTISPECIES: ATP-dependent DNA helicase RecG [Alcaligenes]|jgi:ATP-dependent DNA helicase RecG|uniref:ATP-dependent DNA helicase RecG n=1 Tax=Alcaligenes TaxID=507 RepID=UPI000E95C660|nr:MULTISPECIES: ATP-dependent DNA helicase RecG [Alcaligenes]MCH4223403.1 ATP-dependent DNA helicase RecG [Alcaligenes faecalis]QXR37742.1 ATP-dependent DNA helicase RecG [Alcaligenes aquatilis]HBQ88196.1 ATP-dependent DNA helicase RecG [Alcaligenes faecalis]
MTAGRPAPQAKRAAPRKALSLDQKFEKLGLREPADFVVHLPLRYEDETQVEPIAHLYPGKMAQIEGRILSTDVQARPRAQLHARIADESGELALRWLHFYPSQLKQLQGDLPLRVRGEVRQGFHGLEMVHPKVTKAGQPLARALTPVYPTTDGLSQVQLRKAIADALNNADLRDTLPEAVRNEYGLMPFNEAIRLLHYPPPELSYDDLFEHGHPAWSRIKFDELLAQQLSLAQARAARQAQRAKPMRAGNSDLAKALLASLPFQLTAAQQRCVKEISADMKRAYPMHRLLQGDVGSGKTIVSAIAAVQAIASGFQVALMAPTEILAEQHYLKMRAWLEPLGVELAWLSGSLGVKAKRLAYEAISSGQARLAVGTQALIQDNVQFQQLGLVILDEQHRFGVGQRLELNRKGDAQDKKGQAYLPHQLNMSATPIPRTLAMAFFADLDVSAIDELPPGRSPIITKLAADNRRDEIMARVRAEVAQGRQAYWVCPLVEESEALQLQTAVDTHAALEQALAPLRVGLIHGRLASTEKAEVMEAFRSGNLDVLVATTVIEVGVDVPNASLMIIEHAERFGLAQLHQLRGRVGRGQIQSVCVLLYQAPLSAIARLRLRAMYETTDGFEIARRDLEQRGPGEFMGMRQSGQAGLRFASLESDEDLIEQAQTLASTFRRDYPDHAHHHLQRWMKGREELLRS